MPSWGGKTALEWGRAVRIVADGRYTYGLFYIFQIPGPTWSALLLYTIRSWTGPDTWAFGESGAVPGNDYRYSLMFDFPTDSGAARLPFPLSLAAASSAATVTGYVDPLAIGLEVFWSSRSWHGRLGLPGIWPEIWRSDGLVGVRHSRCRGGLIPTEASVWGLAVTARERAICDSHRHHGHRDGDRDFPSPAFFHLLLSAVGRESRWASIGAPGDAIGRVPGFRHGISDGHDDYALHDS